MFNFLKKKKVKPKEPEIKPKAEQNTKLETEPAIELKTESQSGPGPEQLRWLGTRSRGRQCVLPATKIVQTAEPVPEPETEQDVQPDIKPEEPADKTEPSTVQTTEPETVQETTPEIEPEIKPSPAQKTGIFSALKKGLQKTRQVLTTDINELFVPSKAIDEDLFEELEEVLVTSDLGIDITMALMEKIRKKAKKLSSANELKQVLKEEILSLFPDRQAPAPESAPAIPHVIMVVGVNGTGKTTTLGKLAMKFSRQKKKVLIAAADTFRAAAIEQVQIWAERAGADIVKHKEGADPAAVAYDAVEASLARNIDIVLIDTAGRLHTQKNLMEELKKIKRSVNKKMPGAPHDVLMVLDATTGQNAISQAGLFDEAVDLTQIALTKLDGTAKGGIVAAIASSMDLPITYVGVGEQIDDLREFEAKSFVDALFD